MNNLRMLCLSILLIFTLAPWSIAEFSHEREVIIKVNGMFCPFCTFGIEKHLRKLPETDDVRIDLAAGEAIITLKPEAAFVEKHFSSAVKQAGFTHSGISLRKRTDSLRAESASSISSSPTGKITHVSSEAGFTYFKMLGGPGRAPGQFNQPMNIAFALDGWFVVTDAGNARVQQFYSDGRPWRQWSISGDGKTSLTKPVGVAISPQGDIWVSDYDADTISHYGPDGTPRGIFGQSGTELGQLNAPSGLAVTPKEFIAVADFYNHRLQLFDPKGNFIRRMGTPGLLRRMSISGLNYPTNVIASSDGTLWVADAYNHRVVAFDHDGKVIRQFGKKGHKSGQFDVSAGIALLPNGQFAVADFMNHRIQVWSTEGNFVVDFGIRGAGPGEFERPTDIALAPDGALYVVDWGNNRIQVFLNKGSSQ